MAIVGKWTIHPDGRGHKEWKSGISTSLMIAEDGERYAQMYSSGGSKIARLGPFPRHNDTEMKKAVEAFVKARGKKNPIVLGRMNPSGSWRKVGKTGWSKGKLGVTFSYSSGGYYGSTPQEDGPIFPTLKEAKAWAESHGRSNPIIINPSPGQHSWSSTKGGHCTKCGLLRKTEKKGTRWKTSYGVKGAGPRGGTVWDTGAGTCEGRKNPIVLGYWR